MLPGKNADFLPMHDKDFRNVDASDASDMAMLPFLERRSPSRKAKSYTA